MDCAPAYPMPQSIVAGGLKVKNTFIDAEDTESNEFDTHERRHRHGLRTCPEQSLKQLLEEDISGEEQQQRLPGEIHDDGVPMKTDLIDDAPRKKAGMATGVCEGLSKKSAAGLPFEVEEHMAARRTWSPEEQIAEAERIAKKHMAAAISFSQQATQLRTHKASSGEDGLNRAGRSLPKSGALPTLLCEGTRGDQKLTVKNTFFECSEAITPTYASRRTRTCPESIEDPDSREHNCENDQQEEDDFLGDDNRLGDTHNQTVSRRMLRRGYTTEDLRDAMLNEIPTKEPEPEGDVLCREEAERSDGGRDALRMSELLQGSTSAAFPLSLHETVKMEASSTWPFLANGLHPSAASMLGPHMWPWSGYAPMPPRYHGALSPMPPGPLSPQSLQEAKVKGKPHANSNIDCSKLNSDEATIFAHSTSAEAAAVAANAAMFGPEALALEKQAVARAQHKRPLRLWAHIYLHMQAPDFDLVPMIIGRGGSNMKKIAAATGAKLRVRGRGSGHLEVDGKREAPTPLMVAVTTEKHDAQAFRRAIEMTLAELRHVEFRFRSHCNKEKHPCEGPCFSIGLLADGAQELLGDALDGVHVGVVQ